jgi:RNA polymerase sigma-70 factor (ECF subfamily)
MAAVTLDSGRVWSDLHAGLRQFVSRRVRNQADVDDVVQRVFLQVHRSLPSLRDADRLHAWIYQATRRAIADYYRSPVQRREVPAGDALDVAPDAASIEPDEAPTAEQELAACIRPLLSALATADQEALRLVEVESLTQVEAARRLGITPTAMKSRVRRARTRLRAVVEACCRVELDRRGGLVSYTPRRDEPCGRCEP